MSQQGSAADIVMMAMIKLWKSPVLKELNWKLLLQIHDEVILEGPKESMEQVSFYVEIVMTCCYYFWRCTVCDNETRVWGKFGTFLLSYFEIFTVVYVCLGDERGTELHGEPL